MEIDSMSKPAWMVIPTQEDGQIILTAYGWYEGALYRWVHDQSDHSITWSRLDEGAAERLPETWHPRNSPPPTGGKWIKCKAPLRRNHAATGAAS